MKVLILDTETTGLPDYKNRLLKTPKWYTIYPDVVQISWILYDDETFKIYDVKDYIIDIGKFIPEPSSKIHGITNEIMKEKGVKFSTIIPVLVNVLKCCDIFVCHNLNFDKKMVQSAMMKCGTIDIFNVLKIKEYCTMLNSIDICNIKKINFRTGLKENKWPRLSELHNYFFGVVPNGLHNSMNDVLVTLRCYHMLKYGVDILHYSQELSEMFKKL
jgi:DNA polymerase III subunit epsilon